MRKNLIAASIAFLMAGMAVAAYAAPADNPKPLNRIIPMKSPAPVVTASNNLGFLQKNHRGAVTTNVVPNSGLGLRLPNLGFGFVTRPPTSKLII